MRNSRDLHTTSWIISLIVAGSALLSMLAGGLLPHIHSRLLGNVRAILVLPEIFIITLSATLVVEAFIRKWNGSRQFGLPDLFLLTTAVAVVLSLLMTEQRLARQSGALPSDSPWLLPWLPQIPAIFGLGCVVYAIAWGVENAVQRFQQARKTPSFGPEDA